MPSLQQTPRYLPLVVLAVAICSLAAAVVLDIWSPADAHFAWTGFGAALVYLVGVHTPVPPSSPSTPTQVAQPQAPPPPPPPPAA